MILQALYQLAKREALMADPDYEMKPVAWLVRVAKDGSLLGIERTLGTDDDPKSVKAFPLPREKGRTSGERAFFLYDKAEYVLGVDPTGKRDAKALQRRQGLFREKVRECAEATNDKAVAAIQILLDNIASGEVAFDQPEGCKTNDLFTFAYGPDHDHLVVERPKVREYWKSLRQAEASRAESKVHCLVSGDLAAPADRIPLVKKVPGGSTSGVSLVSFNQRSFESYGWSGSNNATISQSCAEACMEALRRLVDRDYRNLAGEAMPRRSIVLSSDTIVCYWSAGGSDWDDFMGDVLEANPANVKQMYHSIWTGKAPVIEDASQFYALVLSGAQGRATVREWIQTTVQQAADNLARFFDDIRIVRNCPPAKRAPWPPSFPMRRLLESLAVHGKSENVPSPLAAKIIVAALNGTPFPLAVLQRALVRARAEVMKDSWPDLARRDARAAMIKAILKRNFGCDMGEAMNETETDMGYLLGRLMAIMERMQQLALGEVGATVVDRFFSSASATPAAAFRRLLKNCRHHASKARDSSRPSGAARWLEKQLDEIVSKIPDFPSHLPVKQQGLFVLGYHHQRHALWTKKPEPETSAKDGATA